VAITVGLLCRALLSLLGLRPAGTSVTEALEAYWHVAWQYAIRRRDV
jgi:hypothetical protein